MDLARTRRLNRSLADKAAAAKHLQANLRRAIDPVGPCIQLARKLIPILQRNAAVRGYADFREGTHAVRRLQAAARMVRHEMPFVVKVRAALDLERWVRALLSLRQYEESLSRADRAAAAAMTAHGDPSGWGLWERAADSSLWSIPHLLLRSGQFEALQRTLSIAFLSRLIEARGVHAALVLLRCAPFNQLGSHTLVARAWKHAGGKRELGSMLGGSESLEACWGVTFFSLGHRQLGTCGFRAVCAAVSPACYARP